jgi:SAM-dependent methyltransferase
MITYADTKRGWDAAAAKMYDVRRPQIHPTGVLGDRHYYHSGSTDAHDLCDQIARIKGIVDVEENSTIIEYGCGDGRITWKLPDIFEMVYAVDFSYSMLQNVPKNERIQPILSVDNMFGIAHPADYAFSLHVFIHNNYESGIQIMKSISDNLKPGGLALLQIPIYDVPREPESWTGVGVWSEAMLKYASMASGFEILELNKNTGSFSYEQPGPNHFNYQIMRKTAE